MQLEKKNVLCNTMTMQCLPSVVNVNSLCTCQLYSEEIQYTHLNADSACPFLY